MMKQGISTQLFVFIFALLMVIFVLGFGIRSLMTVNTTAQKVELLTFVRNFDDAVQEYYNLDVGSSKVIELSLPGKVEQVCFANPKERLRAAVDQDLRYLLQNNKQDNLYILPLDAFTSPAPDFTIANLWVDAATNPLCVSVQGKLRVLLETALQDNTIFVQVTEV